MGEDADFPAGYFQQTLQDASPLTQNLIQAGTPSFENIVSSLPNTGGWDAINSLMMQRINSVTYDGPNNPCGFTDPAGTTNGTGLAMAAGLAVMGLSAWVGGPVGEALAIAGNVEQYGGAGFTIIVEICKAL